MSVTEFSDSPAAVAAKQTTKPPPPRWSNAELRVFARDRAYGICEWPECGDAGAELAHLFGKGSGGRRSANEPDNVAYLCRSHHDVLDGRRRLKADDVLPLIRTMPTTGKLGTSEIYRCRWYCDRPAYAGRLCERHDDIAHGQTVPGRRTELGLAMSFLVAKANKLIGLE
jgi:hypothetical protein